MFFFRREKKEELIGKYIDNQNKIDLLLSSIENFDKQKEYWFKRKEDFKVEINSLVKDIKEFKFNRDKVNAPLEDLKQQKNKNNSELKSLLKRLRNLNEDKSRVLKEYDVKINPQKLQERINYLEKQVETETSFKREKVLMVEIRKLKGMFNGAGPLLDLEKKIDAVRREVAEARKKEDEFHNKMQDLVGDKSYSDFIESSKKIIELKKMQEEAFQNFINNKDLYLKARHNLKIRIENVSALKNKVDREKEISDKEKVLINKKAIEIEEKLRREKKLTTEDIITLGAKER